MELVIQISLDGTAPQCCVAGWGRPSCNYENCTKVSLNLLLPLLGAIKSHKQNITKCHPLLMHSNVFKMSCVMIVSLLMVSE